MLARLESSSGQAHSTSRPMTEKEQFTYSSSYESVDADPYVAVPEELVVLACHANSYVPRMDGQLSEHR